MFVTFLYFQVLVLTHLDADTTYLIQVAAFTVKGDGAASIPRLAKTYLKLPDPPHIFGSIRHSSVVLIRWRTEDNGVLSYKLRYGKSLKRLRGRQMEELKMKEITFLSNNSHAFEGLGKSDDSWLCTKRCEVEIGAAAGKSRQWQFEHSKTACNSDVVIKGP